MSTTLVLSFLFRGYPEFLVSEPWMRLLPTICLVDFRSVLISPIRPNSSLSFRLVLRWFNRLQLPDQTAFVAASRRLVSACSSWFVTFSPLEFKMLSLRVFPLLSHSHYYRESGARCCYKVSNDIWMYHRAKRKTSRRQLYPPACHSFLASSLINMLRIPSSIILRATSEQVLK